MVVYAGAFDKAEAARAAATEKHQPLRELTKVTQQGELRARAAKKPAGPFDMRAGRTRASNKTRQIATGDAASKSGKERASRSKDSSKLEQSSQRTAAEGRNKRSVPVIGEQIWDPKTQGYTGTNRLQH